MNLNELFQEYEQLAVKAEQAFQKLQNEYSNEIKCEVHCSDCCSSVFGLFLIEAAYLNYHFNNLDESLRKEAVLKGDKADEDLQRLEKRLKAYKDDPRMMSYAMSRERIRCPLLSDKQECLLYNYRPITCRLYGIPTVSRGQIHACWKAGFKKGENYPAYDLDALYKELYGLSTKVLEAVGLDDTEKASFLVSVSKAIKTPTEQLVNEI